MLSVTATSLNFNSPQSLAAAIGATLNSSANRAADKVHSVTSALSIFDGETREAIAGHLVADKVIKAADWYRVKHQLQIVSVLGKVPAHASEFLALYLKANPVGVRADGSLNVKTGPVLDGMVVDIKSLEKSQGQKEDIVDHAVKKYQRDYTLGDLVRKLNILNDQLKLEFKQHNIAYVVEEWYENEKLNEWMYFVSTIAYHPRALGEWSKLVDAAFSFKEGADDSGMVSKEVTIAILKKFIWQVKRKVFGKKVTDHLMVIFFGPQGKGKSGFTQLLTSPLQIFRANTDFSQITDNRNIGLFKDNYILNLDEMSHAAKADIESVKRVITAEKETKREMRSNSSVTVDVNCTLIGSTNKLLKQLIKDETGLRRFFELHFKRSGADWPALNSVDMVKLWQSVNEDGPDPTTQFMDVIKQVQLSNVSQSTVAEWAVQFSSKKQSDRSANAWTREQAYTYYKDWCNDYYSKSVLNFSAWQQETQRLITYNDSEPFPLVYKKKPAGMRYMLKESV